MLRNIGIILGNYVFLPAWDMLVNTFGEARIRLANMARVMILAFPVMLFFHIYLHSPIPVWLYGISAGIVALLVATDLVNIIAVIDISFAWFTLVNQAVRTVLTGLGVPAHQINLALEAMKAEINKYASGQFPTVRGAFGAGLNAFLTVVQVPALAGEGATKAADAMLEEFNKLLTERRAKVTESIKTRLKSAGGMVALVEFWLLAVTAFFAMVVDAWKFPLAAGGVVVAGALFMLALPNSRRISLNKYTGWALAISAGVLLWIVFISPNTVYTVTGARLAGLAGLVVAIIVGLRIVGTLATVPFYALVGFAFALMSPAISQRVMNEHQLESHVSWKKWRLSREGGCRRFYPGEVQGTTLRTISQRGGLTDGEYYFRPIKIRPGQVPTVADSLKPGDILAQLEEHPTVGADRELYVWVVLIGDDDLPAIDVERESFYLPVSYLEELNPEVFTAAFITNEPPSRIDPREGWLGKARFEKRWWGTWSPFTRPFADAPAVFASPLEDSLARVMNVFHAPRGSEEHLAVDLLPSGGKRVYKVMAAADGVVEDLTIKDPYFSVTLIHALADSDTVRTHYGHLFKVVDTVGSGRFKVGATVKAGEKIGEVSASNRLWYQEGTHLHFAVLGHEAEDRYIRPRDPLRYLGRYGEEVWLNGIYVYPLKLQPMGADSSEFWVPPNFTVCQTPVWVDSLDEVQIEVLAGSYFPNEDWGEPDNRETGPAGLSGVPKYGFQFDRAVPNQAYAALSCGIDGLQEVFTSPQWMTFDAQSQGFVCLGLNEFVMHRNSGVYHDGSADNTGAGFKVRVKVTRR